MSGNFIASSASTFKIYLWKESYRFHRGFDFSRCGHIYPYRSFVMFKQGTTSFFFFCKLIIAQKQQFFFSWFQESINKVLAELLITTPSATDGSSPFNCAVLCELHLPGDARSGSHHPRTILIIQTTIYFSQIWLTFLSVFISQTRSLFLLLLFVFISLKHILIFFEIKYIYTAHDSLFWIITRPNL